MSNERNEGEKGIDTGAGGTSVAPRALREGAPRPWSVSTPGGEITQPHPT